jgi:hypothetical protein
MYDTVTLVSVPAAVNAGHDTADGPPTPPVNTTGNGEQLTEVVVAAKATLNESAPRSRIGSRFTVENPLIDLSTPQVLFQLLRWASPSDYE